MAATQPRIHSATASALRFAASAGVWLGLAFVINNFIAYAFDQPVLTSLLTGGISAGASAQLAIVMAAIGGAVLFARRPRDFNADAAIMDRVSTRIIAAAFWGVLLIGVADAVLSFLRVEGLHTVIFGESLGKGIALSAWRGMWVHIPLIAIGTVIGWRDRSVPVVWLILLVVLAELLIVIARFIFSYEQTFMGDLVRFWYAALFLFASAYTLKEEGHVRVDVIFAGFSGRRKAWANATGTVLFGIPLCWIVIWRGLSSKTSIINGPMLNFETAMSGFGMYIKYLMAAFLIVFALSMLAQFCAYFFSALAVLDGETAPDTDADAMTKEGA